MSECRWHGQYRTTSETVTLEVAEECSKRICDSKLLNENSPTNREMRLIWLLGTKPRRIFAYYFLTKKFLLQSRNYKYR